jgi:phenylacetate-CoA ligase
VQSETVLVEILADDGRRCEPGEIGRVVATPLHNAAMPLVRYDLQDFAEVGSACACGRGLLSLKRIAGRQRNMVTLPDGRQRWPGLGRGQVLAALPPIRQYQIVQTTIDQLEIRFVQAIPFSPAEEQQIRDHIRGTFGYPFDIQLRYVDEIKRSRNGKFEEFISLL